MKNMTNTQKQINKRILDEQRKELRAQKKRALARFVNLQSMNGNDWAIFRIIVGGRMTGKSYSVTERMCQLNKKLGDNVKCYWMRISETSTKQLLLNKADKLVDPDLKRKYELELTTKGGTVYNRGKTFCEVYPLCSFGKLKGVGFFDKDFTGKYFIVLDEFQLEQGEKRTSFDILYNFIGMIENIARTTKNNIEVWILGNTLEEASTILKAFNFIPEKFGRFKLRSKRCVIDNLEPTEEYLKDRKGSIADILGGGNMSNYTNMLNKDKSLITKERGKKPTAIIKFGKTTDKWYTVWDGKLIKKYNKEKLPIESDFCMLPYINSYYSLERRQTIFDMYNARVFKFPNLIVQAYFQEELRLIKKS